MHDDHRETALILVANRIKETAELPRSSHRNRELIQLAQKVTELAGAA
jgi:hypothetical protein